MNIPNIFEWFLVNPHENQAEWLILGKGPSFSRLAGYDTQKFRIFTLNDSIRSVQQAAIAHFIDFDAFKRCRDELHLAEVVLMPWYPHFRNKPSESSLSDLLSQEPVLQELVSQRRLYWYDLSTSINRHGDFPVISATYFSSEAALDLLATAGVSIIRSLGIDGGSSYSGEFSDLIDKSLLSNGRGNFDSQFERFPSVIMRTGLDYSPLYMETPIRVFVASSASEILPVKVLEYSIRQHASATVTVSALFDFDVQIPKPLSPENQPRTPFSFQRFLIPQVCKYAGHAIYLDSDMLVFKDILELWQRPLGDFDVLTAYSASSSGRKPQYSVMLMNCSRLNWDIGEIVKALDSGVLNYSQLMYDFSLAKTNACIEPEWNSLEIYKPGRTALLHYTDMYTQPWVSTVNPLGYLWVNTLRKAIGENVIPRTLVDEEVRKGHVRPSLLYQLDYDIDDPILLPAEAVAMDVNFTPPFRDLRVHGASPWRNWFFWLQALLRSKYQKTLLHRLERRIIRGIRNVL